MRPIEHLLIERLIQVAEQNGESYAIPHIQNLMSDLTRWNVSARLSYIRYVTSTGVSRTLPLVTQQLRDLDASPRREGVPCIEGFVPVGEPAPSMEGEVASTPRIVPLNLPQGEDELEEGEIPEEEGEPRG
jgi:hypothetical protein